MGNSQKKKGGVSFRLLYHPLIVRDLKHLSHAHQIRIESALASKLTIAPEVFGKPLSGNLGGYWKLRVGDWRVVFKVVKTEIWVLAIVHRRTVYRDVLKRLMWTP